MNKITLLLVLAFCLHCVGCSGQVDEVRAFIDEKDDVLLQMYKKVEADPTAAGMDEARKVFESRKASLIFKRDTPALSVNNTVKYSKLALMLADIDINDSKILKSIQLLGNTDPITLRKYHALWEDFNKTVKRH
jgi:hypothetical protein